MQIGGFGKPPYERDEGAESPGKGNYLVQKPGFLSIYTYHPDI